jgi:hypothetical protein
MLRDFRLLLVLGVAIGLWMPLAWLDWFTSHEMVSYVVRTVEWTVELRAGALYPRWCPDFYGGYGAPFFVFHGPVVYGLAGLLHATALGPFWSLKVVMLLASVLAGVGSYALVLGETRDRDAALLGAAAYLAAPYRLGDLYERGDLAEFTCIALLPLVIALYRAVAREALPGRAQRLAVAASVAHALMIMTHPVLGLWGTLVVGLVVLVSVVQSVAQHKGRGLALVAAVAGAPALAGMYIVPAIAYRGMVRTSVMVTSVYDPTENWASFAALFAGRIPEFTRNFLRIGPLWVLAAIVVLVALAKNPRRAWPALVWFGFAGLLLLAVGPHGNALWATKSLPLAAFIQFPWRLLGPAALLVSLALGIAGAAATEHLSEALRTRIAAIVAALLLFFVAWPYVGAKAMATDDVPVDADNIRQWMLSTTTADEFLPNGGSAPARAATDLVTGADGVVVVEHTSNVGSHHLLALRAESDGAQVSLALHAFPGWTVATDSAPGDVKAALDTDSRGLLRLRLPTAGEYRLRVWYGVSGAALVGGCVTGLAALVMGLLLMRTGHRRPWEKGPQTRARRAA